MRAMTDSKGRTAMLVAFQAWCELPGYPHERMDLLQRQVAADPEEWCNVMLGLASSASPGDETGWWEWAVRAALAESADRDILESALAMRAREDRMVASVVGPALRFGSLGVGERHAIDVLGEELIFTTWSRLQSNWRLADGVHQQPSVTVDGWASDLMDGLCHYDPDLVWTLFLHYLAFEDDEGLRGQAGIAWLESINFIHAAKFIERTEVAAAHNVRLRAVLRCMYPPTSDPDVERRFKLAMAEPTS